MSCGLSSATCSVEVSAFDVDRYEIVVVSYHSKDQVVGLLSAIEAPGQKFVLVDNASGADDVGSVLAGFSHGRYIDGENSGFAAAANKGALSSHADFVVFANPDCRPTPETLQALLTDLDADAQVAAVAASTTDAYGRIELGVGGWEPTFRRCLMYATGLYRIVPSAGLYAKPRVGQPVSLGWTTGAFMAVRRSLFVSLGGFDERYFVYNEDMAFGRQVRAAGLKQLLRTDLLVPHGAGGSGAGSTKMLQQRGASMAAYLHDHNPPAAATPMRAVLAVGVLARSVIEFAVGRREVARIHLAYVWGITTGRSPFRPGTPGHRPPASPALAGPRSG